MQQQPAIGSPAGHRFEEHTGEVRVRLNAPSFEQLLVEAGRALAELMADEPPRSPLDTAQISLTAPDRGALLVQWLNELIFLSETRKRIYSGFEIHQVSANRLEAEVRGWTPSRLRTQVKAATFHRLSVTAEGGGFSAQVVLDV